ncbi:NifB/NifX family molybdenum-iron cluster-binding protein [uncultured Propionivibrio sp.]|uniref:NifB/NifX family molybdenum-iron cluster-binding protein n=1 Tax=uncultured Propionivibrio sp. TaxID=426737 RepID=UPI0029C006CD|nr:NifB/NifX family molybdenum-iron cluster-binding protein [uncultured Propionivibrio sp.]
MSFLPTDPSTEPTPCPPPSGRKLALAWSTTETVPAMLKVAFATSDRATVDQHFGASLGFAIHAIDGERTRLVEVAEFPEESMDGNEDKLAQKISALAGCAAVYCLAVGGSAVRQLLAAGIQPFRLDDERSIDSLLDELRRAVHDGGVAWIDRIVRREADADRFERMAEEGWQE